jgi:hypothetical protein
LDNPGNLAVITAVLRAPSEAQCEKQASFHQEWGGKTRYYYCTARDRNPGDEDAK